MSAELPNENILRQYLLGTLPEAECSTIEQKLMNDGEFGERIEVAEDEIIEDYLQGGLSAAERRAVERHFLRPPERRRKLWFARLLHSRLQGQKQPAPEPAPVPWFRRPALVWATSLAAAVLFVAVLGLGVHTANLNRTLESERAKRREAEARLQHFYSLNRERNPISPLPAASNDSFVTYFSSPSRAVVLNLMELDRGQPGLPELNQNVEIRIALVHGVLDSYQATLQSASHGKKIWSKAGLKPIGKYLIFTIPRTILTRGEYSVIILGQGDSHEATYPFVVR